MTQLDSIVRYIPMANPTNQQINEPTNQIVIRDKYINISYRSNISKETKTERNKETEKLTNKKANKYTHKHL